MGGLALIARQLGFKVTGCDANVYPPMSTFLTAQGVAITDGFGVEQLSLKPDLWVVGNVVKRGMPLIEAILNQRLPYLSGPEWLFQHVLKNKKVLAVAGTHGKTSTSSMLAHILTDANLSPGFLIGGIAKNFMMNAELGRDPYFVIEADEYDCAFFDKRSKFIHYRPQTLITTNLEFDHADIFDSVTDIQKQFHHLIRTVPSEGLIIHNAGSPYLQQALEKGCWTPKESFGSPMSDWTYELKVKDASCFSVSFKGELQGKVSWRQLGEHNVQNALAAIAAARHIGIAPKAAMSSLEKFEGVKRRLEFRGIYQGVKIYDDFAHHPTAVRVTLEGLKNHISPAEKIIAVIEPRSNTMRMGAHGIALKNALQMADVVVIYQPPNLGWSLRDLFLDSESPVFICESIDQIVAVVRDKAKPGDHVLVMSNGGFGGVHEKLLAPTSG